MIPEFGNFALVVALCFAVTQAIIPLLGTYRGNRTWIQMARPLALGQFFFLLFAYATLTYAFINNDFFVAYVAANSNTHLPLLYRITAVWGAHEGSMLLWTTILGVWTAAVAFFSRSLPEETTAQVLAILGLISFGFILFIITTSNPFATLLPNIPLQGRDLNPLLQDPGLAIHPPMLYMGYVGFSVAFAFAIAALLSGRLDAAWARWSRPWTIAAWCFLTLGITLGSWWSYRVLGWGGWWAWDPVENASFLPWLVGTALMHSLIVCEKRNAFKGWTVLLAIMAFSLSLFGTFLVRSGILTSVHAFALDPTRGVYMLLFLLIVVGCSLTLYAFRAHRIHSGGQFNALSRETFLLSNNVLLFIMMTTILLGTLYPLFIDAMHAGKISVGPPYFNAVFIPLSIPLFILLGIGPLMFWQKMPMKKIWQRIWLGLLITLVIGVVITVKILGHIHIMVIVGLTLAAWIIALTLIGLIQRIRQQGWRQSRNYYGMILAHLGVGVCIIGITVTSVYSIEKDVSMRPGNTAQVGQYQFTFMRTQPLIGPNYTGVTAVFTVKENGHYLTTLNAEKRLFPVQHMATTEAAIDAGLFRDLYISLGDPLRHGGWSLRLYYKPFVRWVWLGGLLMLFGGILALSDRRYKLAKRLATKTSSNQNVS